MGVRKGESICVYMSFFSLCAPGAVMSVFE